MSKPSTARCTVAPAGRRRLFWATRADAGGSEDGACGVACGVPGLMIVPVAGCGPLGCHAPPGCASVSIDAGATISTENWIEGLILNILMTDAAREDSDCGYLPGVRGGHWSDAYRGDGLSAGSRLRSLDINCSIDSALAIIESAIAQDLTRLVTWGLAHSIEPTARYIGRNQVAVTIVVTGERLGEIRVGLRAHRMREGWVWDTQRVVM